MNQKTIRAGGHIITPQRGICMSRTMYCENCAKLSHGPRAILLFGTKSERFKFITGESELLHKGFTPHIIYDVEYIEYHDDVIGEKTQVRFKSACGVVGCGTVIYAKDNNWDWNFIQYSYRVFPLNEFKALSNFKDPYFKVSGV